MSGIANQQTGERTLIESLLHYYSILSKYRRLIVLITAAVSALTIVFSVVSLILPPERSPLPNIYSAQASMLIRQGSENTLSISILSALGIDPGASESPSIFDNGELVLQVLRSRTFLDKVIEEFDLIQRYNITEQVKSASRKLIMAKSSFEYNRTTRTVTISYEDIDPVFARDVTNRMVTLLNDWFAQNMGNSKLRERQLLEEKVNEVKIEVTNLESHLKDLQEKYGVLTAQDLGTSSATALASLRSQLIMKEIEIKNYSTISAIEDPKLQQLKEERQNILDLISEQMKGSGTEMDNSGGPPLAQKSLPELQLEFNHLAMELDVQRRIYNTLSHQYEVLKLTSEPASAFQVLELAEIPDSKSGPKRVRIIAIVTIFAFLSSVGFAFFLNMLAPNLKNIREHLVKH